MVALIKNDAKFLAWEKSMENSTTFSGGKEWKTRSLEQASANFQGYVVSVVTTQFCHCSREETVDNM